MAEKAYICLLPGNHKKRLSFSYKKRILLSLLEEQKNGERFIMEQKKEEKMDNLFEEQATCMIRRSEPPDL